MAGEAETERAEPEQGNEREGRCDIISLSPAELGDADHARECEEEQPPQRADAEQAGGRRTRESAERQGMGGKGCTT